MPRRSLTLRQRLMGGFLALLVLVLGGAFLVVRHYVGEQVRTQARAQLQQGYALLEHLLSRYQDRLFDRAQLVVQLPSLQRVVQQLTASASAAPPPKKEKETAPTADVLPALLGELRKTGAADALWVTDLQGRILAGTEAAPVAGTAWQAPGLLQRLQWDQPVAAVQLLQDRWYLTAVLPIRAGETVVGFLITGLELTETFLARVVEVTHVEIALRSGEHVLASAGWPQAPLDLWPEAPLFGVPVAVPRRPHLLMVKQLPFTFTPLEASVELAFLKPVDEALIQRIGVTMVWVGLFTMLVGVTLAMRIVRSVADPVQRLVRVTRAVEEGDIASRSDVTQPRELGELSLAFNQMLDRLQRSYEELAQLNATLEQRVRERTQALEQAQAQLVQSEKLAAIGELAAGVAHEVNNPLMAILGSIQLVGRSLQQVSLPKDQAEKIGELMDVSQREAHRAKRIVSNLLDFARIKPPMKAPTDLHKLLDGAAYLVSHQIAMDAVQVERQYAPGLPVVLVDPDQMTQVFVNVILNAVQAMSKGGRLSLKTSLNQADVMVTIQDTGCGIPPKYLTRVFDPFFTAREVGQGTGLGLSVSFGIVQQHHGRIEIASTVQVGTTVSIHLPLAPIPGP